MPNIIKASHLQTVERMSGHASAEDNGLVRIECQEMVVSWKDAVRYAEFIKAKAMQSRNAQVMPGKFGTG